MNICYITQWKGSARVVAAVVWGFVIDSHDVSNLAVTRLREGSVPLRLYKAIPFTHWHECDRLKQWKNRIGTFVRYKYNLWVELWRCYQSTCKNLLFRQWAIKYTFISSIGTSGWRTLWQCSTWKTSTWSVKNISIYPVSEMPCRRVEHRFPDLQSGYRDGVKIYFIEISTHFKCWINSSIYATPSNILRSAGSVGVALIMWLVGSSIAALGTAVYIELGTVNRLCPLWFCK